MATAHDNFKIQRPVVMDAEFPLQKPASRASSLGIPSTKPSRPLRAQPSALRRAHTVSQSESALATGRTLGKDRGRHLPQRVPPQNRNKDGTKDALVQRSLVHKTATPNRVDNTFAVANVGNNGKLYLRPLVESGSRRHPSKFHSKSDHTSPVILPQPFISRAPSDRDPRHSVWSSYSQFSELRPKVKGEHNEAVNGDSIEMGLQRRRHHSFSTISEYDQSDVGDEFRIVIDRLDTQEPTETTERPALQVPIPHYRLGTMQFNADGTPILRSSIYTYTSDNTNPSMYLKDSTGHNDQNRIPSTYDTPGLSRPVGMLSVAMSLFSGVPASAMPSRYSDSTQRSGLYSVHYPIEPAIFNYLSENMDDPALVKYLPGSRDISAATPARIVAQISSEAFMDYELVSDFFLTFRSYLSTMDLMALLLARLEWAIKRLQPDGRIIRIRTFAALRHWILNYFVDDFVGNRDLRLLFCETINRMYDELKSRRTAGISDIKILVDLKRCWHGRCLLHWDSPLFTSPDDPALPGDVLKPPNHYNVTANEDINSSSEDNNRMSDPLDQSGRPMTVRESTQNFDHPVLRARTTSSGTSGSVPGSASEHSIHAISCSFPGKVVSIPPTAMTGPHPVVVAIQPSPNTPTGPRSPAVSSTTFRHKAHAHKRSGSFSDSIRDDRAPLSQGLQDRQDQEHPLMASREGNSGSLIRGNLFSPVDAKVQEMAPPSPTLSQAPDALREHHARSASEGAIRPSGNNPALRTVIGSIRRALHTKNLSQNTQTSSSPTSLRAQRGKTATLPVNVAFRNDIYRERRIPSKPEAPLRLDCICEQSVRDYREAIGLNPPASKFPNHQGQPIKDSNSFQLRDSRCLPSEVTMGSKSIVIVDDTGLDIPEASGGLAWPLPDQTNSATSQSYDEREENPSPRNEKVPFVASSELLGPNEWHPNTQLSEGTGRISSESRSKTSRLRKYASFHSVLSQSIGAGSDPEDRDTGKKPKSRLLRRRPGGDLRKVQNVHDLAPDQRPQSFVTETSLTESFTSSARQLFRRSFSRSSQARVQSTPPRFDLINTHSSQNLRPSFEAAIAEFSRIPDDVDGGIESTLLKLEGKWPSPTLSDSHGHYEEFQVFPAENSQHNITTAPLGEVTSLTRVPADDRLVSTHTPNLQSQAYAYSVEESELSDNSIPLLERGLSDDSMKRPVSSIHARATTRPRTDFAGPNATQSRGPSAQDIDEMEKTPNLTKEFTEHLHVHAGCDNEDSRSELSSEISDELDEREFEERSSMGSLGLQSGEMPSHPLAHPPSPQVIVPTAPPDFAPHSPVLSKSGPTIITTVPSPTRTGAGEHGGHDPATFVSIRNKLAGLSLDMPRVSDHVPFILAYDSKLLAQQFTLVEKSALDEVDWKDLVEMRWNNTSPSVNSWVHFLAEKERNGIDIVVGRFNLMVKWVLSEIVLTRDISERARTISKYIHIATHARQSCNYSTMLQIAIALSSVDCARLQKTWAAVSVNDRRLLESMESLIQPLRNFHELRVEMETANLANGCIPFVGLYVHDLTYNAQKPSQVAGTRDGDALVNFERYRTSARIVKCLLRLVDASNKYNIEPVPGVIEKCLWIGSLPEKQIQACSKSLE